MLRFLTAKIDLWYVLLLIFILVTFTAGAGVYFGYLVLQASDETQRGFRGKQDVLRLSRFPDKLIQPWRQFQKGGDLFQPQRYRFNEFQGLKIVDEDFVDDGVLLVSAYSGEYDQGTVYLYDIARQEVLHEWVPPLDAMFAAIDRPMTLERFDQKVDHPFLLENGDLVVKTPALMARLDPCSNVVWSLEGRYHHSTERGADGDFYVPDIPKWDQQREDPRRFFFTLWNQGYHRVTADGEVVDTRSLADILNRNGYRGLLLGVHAWHRDRLHMNDAEPMHSTDDYVQKGDVAMSLRNLSTVLLYRPSTDEIIWLQTGPWLWQHDVDYQGDGVFTIYGNDIMVNESTSFQDYNTIYTYDMKTNEPGIYMELNDPPINSLTNGLHRVLPNGDLFIEETWAPTGGLKSLLHRVGPDGLRWSYVHTVDDEWAGHFKWSRYLTREEADFPWLENLNCEPQTAAAR